ncbi:MAG TPA: hypothetical protein VJR46_05960 [Candidatus Dormibacteraeota bacterium]|nr:hypothetical protein [Candidatus Dormibacteraeota bacterium]
MGDPQEQAPPQAQPPPLDSLMKSDAEDSPLPKDAKLETSTRVFVDSQAGHTCMLSRSANLVSTSNFSAQLSHRYS